MVVTVVVSVVVVSVAVVGVRLHIAPLAQAPAQHGHADADDKGGGYEVEPWIELLGNDELRERERDEAQREDPDRVCVTVTIKPR